MLALPFVALLGQVAKVDIRGTGTPNEAILKQLLATTYVTGGIMSNGAAISTDGMTLNEAIPGSWIIEVTTPDATADELTNFWCLHGGQKALFSDLVEQSAGLTVTEIVTCTGASGEGCTESPCSGGESGGTPEPGGDDDDNKLSTVAIVFIVLGSLVAVGILAYLMWPWIETLWKPKPTAANQPMISAKPTAATGAELPSLFAAI